jgi:hypothetical protein
MIPVPWLILSVLQDPFYDSDEYRKDGGNGTQFWIYNRVSGIFVNKDKFLQWNN